MIENEKSALEESLEKELGRMLLTYAQGLKPDWESLLEKKSVMMVEEITAIIQSTEAYPDDQQLVCAMNIDDISSLVCRKITVKQLNLRGFSCILKAT